MKIVLNPKFECLKEFISQIDQSFSQSGKVIFKVRNEIRIFDQNGLQLNVKKYKRPNFINRIAYAFFRPSKAERSYTYALKLLEKGAETPEPVAYIEKKNGGLFSEGYFVSLQSPYRYVFRDISSVQGNEDVLTEFAHFTANLHKNGILHLDYSAGNILFDKTSDGIHFSIIDLNRMKFGSVTEEEGYRNFDRLWLPEDMYRFIAQKYAEYRGYDPVKCLERILYYHKKEVERCNTKNKLKRLGKMIKPKDSIKYAK